MIPRRLTIILLLAMVLLLGGFLRFYRIDGYGLWSDEFVTLQLAQNPGYLSLVKDCFVIPQPIPPLYFLLTKSCVDLLGPSEISLRLLSVLSGTLAIILVFSLGRELFGSSTGIYSALLFAVHPAQLVYAQNARAYAFCLLLCTGSVWFMVRWMQSHKNWHAAGFVLATTLLFYSHYVFAPLLLILNLYFVLVWSSRRGGGVPAAPSWFRWIWLQSLCGLLLLPLAGQMWKVLQSRQALNWSSHNPGWHDYFKFIDFEAVERSIWPALILVVSLALIIPILRNKGFILRIHEQETIRVQPRLAPFALSLALLWVLLPPVLYGVLYRTAQLNLFVENYLMIASVPTSLLLPALAYKVLGMNFWRDSWRQITKWFQPSAENHFSGHFTDQFPAHLFLILLVFWTAYDGPWHVYKQRRFFSQGVPGGNEWRETLTKLQTEAFQAPLVFFQSPFIESNRLDFQGNPRLQAYLSAPLESFYLPAPIRDSQLLPVFWHLESHASRQFRLETYRKILAQPDFSLLSTRLFWNDFSAWLKEEAEGKIEFRVIDSYQSTGALMLNRVRLFPHPSDKRP